MSFQDLGARLAEVADRVAAAVARGGHAQRVTLIAVTKTHGPDAVQAAWQAGVHNVGENKVQEALGKMTQVDVPVRWHLIGHLQRNKVRDLEHFTLVHSIDRVSIADAVSAFGIARKRAVDALVQVNVAGETSKGGFAPVSIPAESEQFVSRVGLRITGVMTMAPLGADERETRRVFQGARAARDVLVSAGHPAFDLSMGMSNDYELAVEEGATMIRLGTVLFGERGL
jgi:hypothetical protein